MKDSNRFDKELLGMRLKNVRTDFGSRKFSQEEFGERLGQRDFRTISAYERGEREPKLGFIFDVCQRFDVQADYLLGLQETTAQNERYANGVRWRVHQPVYGSSEAADTSQIGIDLFEELITSLGTIENVRRLDRFREFGVSILRESLKTAIFSGAIEVIHVERDAEIEDILRRKFNNLDNCIVSKISLPIQQDSKIDVALRSEIVGRLAAKEIHLPSTGYIALSGGTTLSRFADLLPHGAPQYKGLTWVPLLTTQFVSETNPFTANDVVARMVYNQPGSKGHRLPFIEPEYRNRDNIPAEDTYTRYLVDEAHKVLQLAEEAKDVFISLGSPEFNYSNSDHHLGLARIGELLDNLTTEQRAQCCGDVILKLIDEDGNRFGDPELQTMNDDLVFSVSLDVLRQIAEAEGSVWAFGTRPQKARATRAALRANYINNLVVDNYTAQALLALES